MVKKFSYPCSFSNGETHPVTFYVGEAALGEHPIGFQAKWLSEERGCMVPEDLMDSLKKLKDLADEQKVSFESLCEYVIAELQTNGGAKKEALEEAVEKEQKKKEKTLMDQRIASMSEKKK